MTADPGTAPGANRPPHAPSNPAPADNASSQDPFASLSWQGGDPDGDAVTYAVYFGTSDLPNAYIIRNLPETTYPLAAMPEYPQPDTTTYTWQVIATDAQGLSTAGPVWRFTVVQLDINYPPETPANPTPADRATEQSVAVDLAWTGSDPDGDPVTYDLYLEPGVVTPTVRLAAGQARTTFDPGALEPVMIYSWQVVAHDGQNPPVAGPVWRFSTAGLPSSRATAITAGGGHTCALTDRGGVRCWGANGGGQVGDGTTDPHLVPVDVPGLGSGVKAISAGGEHTCILTADGGVRCWGYNAKGQLGDGTQIMRTAAVEVGGLGSGVTAIAAGRNHTCALTDGGGVKCWGDNLSGQLGDGTQVTRTAPVDVVGLSRGVTAIAAGGGHTCALTGSGGVKCWGSNTWGALGDSTMEMLRLRPVDVKGLQSGVTAIAAGLNHTCALTDSGSVKCWGNDFEGEVGNGGNATGPELYRAPVDVVRLSRGVTAVATGGFHTVALSDRGSVGYWGLIPAEEGKRPSIAPEPLGIQGLQSGITAIAAGGSHTCVLTTNGGVKCFGANHSGQLGDGTVKLSLTPVDVVGLGGEQP
jgi:alpha-tubulin suppressor-like RCC1 family protein